MWKKEIEKLFFDFEIIAFELVPLDTRFYWERILVIWCQYVNKQSQALDTTKTEFFERIFFLNDQKIWQKFCRAEFKQCFGRFNMWTVHNSSDTGLFKHLSNRAFCSL